MPMKHKTLILVLLTVVASSAVAAEDGPEEVIRALYKAHRPWEHKELNLGNRAVLSKYFSPELTKLFLKNAQLERDCPRATFVDSNSTQSLDLRTSTTTSISSFTSLRQRRRKLADSKHASNCLTERNLSKSKYSFSNLFRWKTDGALTTSFIPRITPH